MLFGTSQFILWLKNKASCSAMRIQFFVVIYYFALGGTYPAPRVDDLANGT
jgi:hypothetical protein